MPTTGRPAGRDVSLPPDRAVSPPAHAFGGSPIRTTTPDALGSRPFVDAALPALDAPICWLPETGAAGIDALSHRPAIGETADLELGQMLCIRHILLRGDGVELVQVRTTDRFVTLRLRGRRAARGPVGLTLLVAGLTEARSAASVLTSLAGLASLDLRWAKRTRRQFLMRDALIALDGHAIGASYREIAVAIVGRTEAKAAWDSPSRALKERIRRALRAGQSFRDGGYRRLIS